MVYSSFGTIILIQKILFPIGRYNKISRERIARNWKGNWKAHTDGISQIE